MAKINNEDGFTQLTKLNVIDRLLVDGKEVVSEDSDPTFNSVMIAGSAALFQVRTTAPAGEGKYLTGIDNNGTFKIATLDDSLNEAEDGIVLERSGTAITSIRLVNNALVYDTATGVFTISADVDLEGNQLLNAVIATKTNFIESKSDLPDPVSGVITLNASEVYIPQGDIDLTGDVLASSSDTVINTNSGSFITNSANPLLTIDGVNSQVVGFKGLENTGGPCVEIKNGGEGYLDCARLIADSSSTAVIVDGSSVTMLATDVSGARLLDISGVCPFVKLYRLVNSAVLQSSGIDINTGATVSNLWINDSEISVSSGKGIYIELGATVNSIKTSNANFTATDNAFHIEGEVDVWSDTNSDFVSTTAPAIKIDGEFTNGLQTSNTTAVSFLSNGIDITSSTIEGWTCIAGAFVSGVGFSPLKGDAASANIGQRAKFADTAFIPSDPADASLDGIDPQDLKYTFSDCTNVEDSYYLGCADVTTPNVTTNPGLGVWTDLVAGFTECSAISRFTVSAAGVWAYEGLEEIPVTFSGAVHVRRDSGSGASLFELRLVKTLDGGSSYSEIASSSTVPVDIDSRVKSAPFTLEDTATPDDGVNQAVMYKLQCRGTESGSVDLYTESGQLRMG